MVICKVVPSSEKHQRLNTEGRKLDVTKITQPITKQVARLVTIYYLKCLTSTKKAYKEIRISIQQKYKKSRLHKPPVRATGYYCIHQKKTTQEILCMSTRLADHSFPQTEGLVERQAGLSQLGHLRNVLPKPSISRHMSFPLPSGKAVTFQATLGFPGLRPFPAIT